MPSFSELATAIWCPRKLYYRRRQRPETVREGVREHHELAFRYPDLLATNADLDSEPIAVTPTQFRARLHAARERLPWAALVDPDDTQVHLDGREAAGVADKVLGSPLAPSVIATVDPPTRGIWPAHSVHAVAAARALAWERGTSVDVAFVEYPTHGVIHRVLLTPRLLALYRRAIATVQSLDAPPPRFDSEIRCTHCAYRPECGPNLPPR